MPSVRVKICGLRDRAMASAAVDAGADYIGLNFVEVSPRYVTVDQARTIARSVAGRVEVVGLIRTSDPIRSIVEQVPLTMVQLHGAIDEQVVEAVGELPMMPAVAFEPRSFIESLDRVGQLIARGANVHAIVVDTPDPTKVGGGTGVSFDWSALRLALDELQPSVPIMLAGGLTPENVAEAIDVVRPFGVDVSSGVESERGVKDAGKVRAFVQAAKARPVAG